MTKPVLLPRRGGELLLRLLERSRPVIAAAALEELPSAAWSTFIKVGALQRHGAGRAAFVAGDDGPTFRDLAWQADQNAYGYFDASDGSVVIAPEAQMLFRVALPWWLEHFSIRLGVSRVREIRVAFFFGNTFEKRGDCSPKLLNSASLHFA